jgi:inorganic triphosphatase YgiF
MSETELKYVAPEAAAHAIDARLRALGGRSASIESRYFDTSDGRLAAAGISLRLRRSGGRWEQTVKAPGRHAFDRLEESVARPGRCGPDGPAVDPALHDGTRAGAVLLASLRRDDPVPATLVHVCTSRVRRRAVEIGIGASRVEVALDRGTIIAGDRVEPICEVEYELKAGDPGALVEIARAGIVAHGLWLGTVSKAARGSSLALQGGRFAAVRARPPRLRRRSSAADLRLAIMSVCVEQVSANAGILARGQLDDEVVHQLRVGLRRLRTAARELDRAVGCAKPAWEAAIATVFGQLGDYRDRSIVADALCRELAAAGSPAPTLRPSAPEVIDPVALVRGAEFQLALLDVIAEAMPESAPRVLALQADGPLPASPQAAVEAGTSDAHQAHLAIATRLAKLHAALERAAKRFGQIGDNERHRVRKRLKRLRYLAELVAPLYGARAVERYLARLRPAQDALGDHIDLIVGIGLARESIDAGDPRAWFNVGWLGARLPRSVKRCRRALVQAATATPFWRVD